MKIVREEDLNKSRDEIVSKLYNVCQNAHFPVTKPDVYDHLYSSADLVSRFLVNDDNEIVGFGVAQNYSLEINEVPMTLAYLQGMVIASEYQGRGYSKKMLNNIYQSLQSNLFGLRTQNPKMALAMLNLFKNVLLKIPTTNGEELSPHILIELFQSLRQISPYQDIDDRGIVRNCYQNQLYPHLNELKKINSSIDLEETSALAVIVQPNTTSRMILSKRRK